MVTLPQKQLHVLNLQSQVSVDDVADWAVNQPLKVLLENYVVAQLRDSLLQGGLRHPTKNITKVFNIFLSILLSYCLQVSKFPSLSTSPHFLPTHTYRLCAGGSDGSPPSCFSCQAAAAAVMKWLWPNTWCG